MWLRPPVELCGESAAAWSLMCAVFGQTSYRAASPQYYESAAAPAPASAHYYEDRYKESPTATCPVQYVTNACYSRCCAAPHR